MKRPRVNRQAVVGTVLEYVWMIFGMFIYSFGWLACIMPANTLGGGAAGLSLLFYHITGLPIGMLTLIVNGVLLLIGGTIVGWNFGMKTIFCIAMLSVTMSVLQPLLAAVTPAGQTLFALDPVSDRILLVILGGIIAGIGIAICFRQGGSTGGTDIIAMIVNKYKTISYGRIVMTVDSMIILSSLFVGDMGVDSVIYGFVVTAVLGYTVDVIQAGNQQSSQIFVFTRRYEAMADQIIATTRHSATILDATGWYSKEDIKVVVVVCRHGRLRQGLRSPQQGLTTAPQPKPPTVRRDGRQSIAPMRNIAFPNLLKTLREYVLMTAGLLIYSFGWIACIKPMEVAAGGGTGLAMIVSHTAAEMWGVDIRIGTVFLTINAFLLLLSGLTVGWNFGFKTLFCIVVASGFMALMEPYFMVHYPPSGDVLGLDDKLLTIILGALLAGAGMAVCFTAGGATGGTDIVAKIFHKYWGVAYGKVIIYTDILIIGSTLLVGYGLSDVVYGYIVTVVVGTSVDLLMAGSQQSNQIFIVTADYDRMAEAILHEADRGVTLIDATGGYSRHEIRIVMVVCYKRDAGHVLRIARDVDPKAFVTIASVSGTYGEGFRKLTQLR